MKSTFKEIFKIISLPVLFASLCCLAPLVLVLLGISTVAFGASLADNLYGNYRWGFRILGVLALAGSLFIYFRSKGVCTIDQAKRRRKFLINTIFLSVVVFVIGYIVFLYVIVEAVGIPLGLWENPIPKIVDVFGKVFG
jgi:uncharacterized membrane protein